MTEAEKQTERLIQAALAYADIAERMVALPTSAWESQKTYRDKHVRAELIAAVQPFRGRRRKGARA